MPKIEINDKVYNVDLAVTEEEKEQGLQNITEMPHNKGMLFVYDEPQETDFWMKNTLIPLDIIFIDEYGEVISVKKGVPHSEELLSEDNVKYVLELNENSGVKPGDDVDLSEVEVDEDQQSEEDNEEQEEEPEDERNMLVLDDNGKVQMELEGGERIFSRKHTVTLARLSKKAYKSKLDKDYKALGRKVFAFIHKQDTQEQQYV